MSRFLFIASLVSLCAVGCGDDKDENAAQNDGAVPADGAIEGGGGEGGIDVGPAPPGFELVADLNTRNDSSLTSYDLEFAEANGKVFFVGEDGVHGLEPMVSDGTDAGTKLLKDLVPGIESGSAGGFIAKGDKMYFFGRKETSTWLYRSDGTPEGTVPVVSAQGGSSTTAFTLGEKLCFLDSTLRCTDPAVTTITKITDTSSSSSQALSLGTTAVFTNASALLASDGVTST